MKELFKFQQVNNQCDCLLDKKKIITFKCTNITCYKNYVYEQQGMTGSKYDILFLSEFPEFKSDSKILSYFKSYLRKVGITSYTIAPALKCHPKERFLKNPVYSFYKKCNVTNFIPDYKQYRVIVPLGHAIFSVTQNSHLKSWEDFSQYLFDMPTYFFDNFGRRVYPLPSFFSFIYEENIDNTFKYRFLLKQLSLIKKYLEEYSSPKLIRGIQITQALSVEHTTEILNKLKNTDFAFDIETTGFDWWKDEIICISFSNQDYMAYFVDWKYMTEENKKQLNDCFKTGNKYIGQNSLFDLNFLRPNGIKDAIATDDTMLMHHLINEERPQSLDFLAYEFSQFGGYSTILDECKVKLKKKYENYKSLYKYFPNEFIKYSAYDSAVTFISWKKMLPQLKIQGLEDFYKTISIPSINTFVEIESHGIKVDRNYLKEYVVKIRNKRSNLEQEIYTEIGEKINLDSPKDLSYILKKKNIPVALDNEGNKLYTKNGDYKLDKETILLYSGYPFIKKLIEYNHLSKLINQLGDEESYYNKIKKNSFSDSIFGRSKFKDGFYKKLYDNRLYISYSLIGTKYGRVSSKGGINGQNFPKDKDFRKIFIPDGIFVELDFNNAEMRLASMIADDKAMQDVINQGLDLHCYAGAKMENVSYEEFYKKYKEGNKRYKEIRQAKKATNFGILYGQMAYGLAYRLNKDIKEYNFKLLEDKSKGLRLNEVLKLETDADATQILIDDYFKMFPGIKKYIIAYRKKAIEEGYIRNPFGRIAHFHKLYGLYNSKDHISKKYRLEINHLLNVAINCSIQGSCGIALLYAMNLIQNKFKELNLKSKLIAQVHDSILIDVQPEELKQVINISKQYMETHHSFYGNVEMKADEQIGNIWGFGEAYDNWIKLNISV